MNRLLSRMSFAAALVVACGCTVIQTGDALTSQSLLKSAMSSDDSVRVDIYWADLPTDGDALWQSIEETRLPTDLRRRLTSNGLRVGVVGGVLPDELLELINPDGEVEEGGPEDGAEAGVASLEETGVSRATYTLTPGRRVDVQAGAVTPSAPVLISRDGELSGRTFNQVQPTYLLELLEPKDNETSPGADLRIGLELRHGEQRLRFTPEATGVISRASMTRDVEPFPELAIPAKLSPGETLVITSTPGAGGRLGGYFHRVSEDSPRRRAMLIHVAAAPRESAFDAE